MTTERGRASAARGGLDEERCDPVGRSTHRAHLGVGLAAGAELGDVEAGFEQARAGGGDVGTRQEMPQNESVAAGASGGFAGAATSIVIPPTRKNSSRAPQLSKVRSSARRRPSASR